MSQWQERFRGLVSWRIWPTVVRLGVLLGAGLLAISPFNRADATEEGAETATESASRAGDRFRDCAGCPEMVVVPAGSFRMGLPSHEEGREANEGPAHEVTIAAPFAIGRHEVTLAEFERFVDQTGYSPREHTCWTLVGGELQLSGRRSWRDPGFSQSGRHPVACVTWDDAQIYAAWLSEETGEEYRLPTESEWEYAARAGTAMARHWEDESDQCRYENGADASMKEHHSDSPLTATACRDGHVHTAPAGSFAANGWGLQDMLGNVAEWAEDCWHDSHAGAPSDGSAREHGDCGKRVVRGDAWPASPVSAATRFKFLPGQGLEFVGFRLARTLAHRTEHAQFTIETAPAHARVRILNIAPAYRDGMRLRPGSYQVEVNADGYEMATESVVHSSSPTLRRMVLRKASTESGYNAGDRFRDCPECPEMVVIPAGSYRMGSPWHEQERHGNEGPVHEVAIAVPFAIGRYEVMAAEFERFVEEMEYSAVNSCESEGLVGSRSLRFGQSERHPVTCVSWKDAQAYVAWLSRETGERYRLPSESEWEYAARGGEKTARHWGEDEFYQCRYANGWDASAKERHPNLVLVASLCRDGHVHTAPAGGLGANGWGLHDMLGNVWEWTEDCWTGSHAGALSDGSTREYGECHERVMRGGSWRSGPSQLRAARRASSGDASRLEHIGFRVARTLAP